MWGIPLGLARQLDDAAAVSGDDQTERLRKTVLIFISVGAVLIGLSGWWYLDQNADRFAAGIALGYALISASGLAHLLVTKSTTVVGLIQAAGLLIVPAGIQLTTSHVAETNSIMFWSILSPLVALMLYGARVSIPWFALFVMVATGTTFQLASRVSMSGGVFDLENLLIVACIVFLTLRHFISERDEAYNALAKEQARSERLLLNILPAPIAERLKEDESATIADGFSDVTVLFADIVGFTPLAAKLEPRELVDMLNQIFSEFDNLVDRYGVEKVKTIGDCYMVCAGIPVPRDDHAAVSAALSLEMLEKLHQFNLENGFELSIRIGLNSGPVVAGVIGLKKFVYDLWGTTVNLASRMESQGLSGRIQMSEATYSRLGDEFVVERRGKVKIKGAGNMVTYFLTGKHGNDE